MIDTDLIFGLKSEAYLLSIIKKTFGSGFEKIQEQFHPFDFQDGDTYLELKTRRCKHDRYPDTMIGYNKLKYAQDRPTCKFKFLFKFDDGLYYHDYDHTKKYNIRDGGRWDRGTQEIKPYCYIPVNELKLIS